MGWLAALSTLDLIDVLNYYLVVAFAVGTAIRLRNYRAILGLIVAFPNRWPKLLELVKACRPVFLRWPTLLPVGLTLVLMLANALASYLLWSHADVTFAALSEHPLSLTVVVASGLLMLVLDCRAIFRVGQFDRTALETDLDRAEHWLQSWKAPAIRWATLGFVNPRKIVNAQVEESLVNASLVVNGQMWSWSLQIGARFIFGLSLWLTWGWVLNPAE